MARRVLVGIDFGFTGTGVCFMDLTGLDSTRIDIIPGDEKLKIIRDWPGNIGNTENKVPTVVAHKYRGGNLEKKFGFEYTNMEDEEKEAWDEWKAFKLCLDKELLDKVKQGKQKELSTGLVSQQLLLLDHTTVQSWYEQFLSFIYAWIQRILGEGIHSIMRHEYPHITPIPKLDTKIDDFDMCEVNYIFSVPTTWEDTTIGLFKSIAIKSGFAKRQLDTVEIGRNEAEAAAIYTMQERNHLYWVGDNLIICDAGGGTTDVTSLRVVKNLQGSSYRMEQLMAIERPEPVGSTLIDDDADACITKKVAELRPQLTESSQRKTISRGMKEFQGVKHSVGTDDFDLLLQFIVSVVQNKPTKLDGVVQQIEIEKLEIYEWFNKQINKIKRFVEKQLAVIAANLEARSNGRELTDSDKKVYLALTGGLGSSAYLKAAMEQYFGARNVVVVQPSDPQLAVCKGLVIDRVLEIVNGKRNILNMTRASYGILVREPVKKRGKNDEDRKIVTCTVTKKDFYVDSIKWLIDQNTHEWEGAFPQKRLFEGSEARWTETLVRHEGPLCNRPVFLKNSVRTFPARDIRIIREMDCEVSPRMSDIDARAARRRRRHLIFGKKDLEIKYSMNVRLSGADLMFELWFNERMLTGERVKIFQDEILPVGGSLPASVDVISHCTDSGAEV